MAHNEHKLILYFICHYCRPLEGGTLYYVSQRATNEYRQEHYIRDFVYKLKTVYHMTVGMVPNPDWRPYTENEKRRLYNRAIAHYKRLDDEQKSTLKHDATKAERQRVYRHNRRAFVKGYKIARGWYDHYQEEYASGDI